MSTDKDSVVITVERAATGDAFQMEWSKKYVIELESSGGSNAERFARCLLAIGKMLESFGRNYDAAHIVHEAYTLDPDNESILRYLIMMYRKLGTYRVAREYMKRLLKLRGER